MVRREPLGVQNRVDPNDSVAHRRPLVAGAHCVVRGGAETVEEAAVLAHVRVDCGWTWSEGGNGQVLNDLNGRWTLPPSLLKEGQFKTLRKSLSGAP